MSSEPGAPGVVRPRPARLGHRTTCAAEQPGRREGSQRSVQRAAIGMHLTIALPGSGHALLTIGMATEGWAPNKRLEPAASLSSSKPIGSIGPRLSSRRRDRSGRELGPYVVPCSRSGALRALATALRAKFPNGNIEERNVRQVL